jgi:RND superfamily putative drug exporter
VLLIAFGSVIAMGAPLLGALLGVGVGMLLIGLLASVMDVMSVAPTMATMIGIAVGIDYALFVVTRHRQHLAFGHSVVESVALATHSAGRSVIFAGVTVVISMLGLTLVGIPLIASMGVAVAITVSVAVLVAITFLPALLGLIGTNIDRLRTPGIKVRAEIDPDSPTAWSARWARSVTRHPWRALAIGVPLLLVLAIPAASLRTGWPDATHRTPPRRVRPAHPRVRDRSQRPAAGRHRPRRRRAGCGRHDLGSARGAPRCQSDDAAAAQRGGHCGHRAGDAQQRP